MWEQGNAFEDNLDMTQNIVNPAWESIDPTPNIHGLFQKFNQKFFQGKLAAVELEWSKRMYQCAGICYSRRSRIGMACVIRLSEPLLKLRSRKELVETLLHEMIHAYLFVLNIREANGGHGPNFLKIAHGINRQTGTNITVYHTFHDEVDFYKKHWWRCDGPCQTRSPYYGYVKRVANRAPGPNDLWWNQHQQTCTGKFVKVKEPTPKKAAGRGRKVAGNPITNYTSPRGGVLNRGTGTLVVRKPPTTNTTSTKSPSPSTDIRTFFTPTSSKKAEPKKNLPGNLSNVHGFAVPGPSKRPHTPIFSGTGTPLGGSSSNKRSRLLDEFRKADTKKTARESRQTSMRNEIIELHPDEEIILLDDDYDSEIAPPPEPEVAAEDGETPKCPICNQEFEDIAAHIEICLDGFGDDVAEETTNDLAEESCILIEPHIDTVEVLDSPVPQRPVRGIVTPPDFYGTPPDSAQFNDLPAATSTGPKKYSCPNCPNYFTEAEINAHLDDCLT